MEQFRRALRALMYAWRATRSTLVLGWYRVIYSGLSVGKGVSIGRGVYLSVTRGATLCLGEGVRIDSYCYLVSEGEMVVGAHSYIGVGSTIVAKQSVRIGSDALIAAYVTIRDQDHRIEEIAEPFRRQGLVTSPVIIGDNVWLGTKATVLRGVEIGSGSIVGSNAVVTQSLIERVVAVGIPARVVKHLSGPGPSE